MNATMNELKSLLEESNRLHVLYMDESIPEEESDEYYEQFFAIARKAAALVASLIGINEATALRMIVHKRGDIMKLLARAA